MFAKIRSLAKQSVVYGLGTVAARAVAFLLLPYYSHLMSPSEYGIYALFMVLVTVLQPLYIHGMDIAFLRYSAAESEENQRRDLGTMLTHTLGLGGMISLLLVFFAGPVAKVVVSTAGPLEAQITQICAGVLLLDTLSYHIFTWLRIRHKPGAFSAVKIVNVLINIALNILFVGVLKLGVLGAFYAFIATSVVVLLILLVLARSALRFSWSWPRVREWVIFGMPNLPSQLFMVAVEFSDRKWIEHYLGVDQAGIYSAGYRIAMLMNMIAQAFRYAWQPFFLQTAEDSDAKETFARVLTYYVLFVGWVWLAAVFFLQPLLTLNLPGVGPLIAETYWASFTVVPVVMLAHILNGVYANFMVGIYLKKKTKVIPLVIGIAAIVNVVGNGLLIPKYGYMVSAWLTVVSYAIIAIGIYLYIAPRYKVPYEWGRLGRIVLTVAAVWAVGVLPENSNILMRGLLLLVLPYLWWRIVLDDDERGGIKRRLGW
ncbi:oligosaccharide flippase family protein [bacterium]|nr:oligosaccharide flippase family protein [bacterium]